MYLLMLLWTRLRLFVPVYQHFVRMTNKKVRSGTINTGTGTGTVCRYINTVLGIIGQSTGRTLSKDGPKVKPPGSES